MKHQFLVVMTAMGTAATIYSVGAEAATVVAIQNQEVVVPVNAELGSVLQFGGAVKTVTPARSFAVSDLGQEVTPGGQKSDVRTFQVKPSAIGASEAVTFVLAGGRSVNLRFVATPNAEKFYDVALETKRTKIGTKFLASELEMMRAMVADDVGGFAREVLDTKVSADVKSLDVKLTRVYSSTDFTGYVFSVSNDAREAMSLSLAQFAIGKPNRAVLAYASKERIEACPLFSTKSSCTASLHFVVRGVKESPPSLTLVPKVAPYVKSESSLGGGTQ